MRNELNTAARELHELGYHLVPCAFGEKRPLIRWGDSASNDAAVADWLRRYGVFNLAIHAGKSGVVVLDADSVAAEQWIHERCPATPMQARTPRGGLHAFYRATGDSVSPATNLFGMGLDVRAGKSLVVASPSYSQKRGNHWAWCGPIITPSALPVLPVGLIHREPLRKPSFAHSGHASPDGPSPIRDVTRWIMEVESVQGSGGSNQCFRVACRLAASGLSWDEAWRWLCLWNGRKAHPPWSEAELRHKLRDAFSLT